MKRIRFVTLLLGAVAAGVFARASAPYEFDFASDIPLTIAGTAYRPFETIHVVDSGSGPLYSLNVAAPAAGLAPGIRIDALARRATDGLWLFSVDVPAAIGGTTYHPSDIVGFNGTSYSRVLDHRTDLALAEDSNINGLAFDSGKAYVSFDAPAVIDAAGTLADPRDIYSVQITGGAPVYQRVLSGAVAGIPSSAKLTGFEAIGSSGYLVTVDIPFVGTSGSSYLPGDIIHCVPGQLTDALYYRDSLEGDRHAAYPAYPQLFHHDDRGRDHVEGNLRCHEGSQLADPRVVWPLGMEWGGS